MGAIALMIGGLFRLGRLRRWAALYCNPSLPGYLRNAVFALVPAGMSFIMMAAGGLLMLVGRPWAYLGLAVAIVSFIGAILSLAVVFHPPRWLKPRWLLEEEERGSIRCFTPTGEASPSWEISERGYVLGWFLVGFFLLLWWLFSWPPSLLVGAGITIPLLLASRPRRDKEST